MGGRAGDGGAPDAVPGVIAAAPRDGGMAPAGFEPATSPIMSQALYR